MNVWKVILATLVIYSAGLLTGAMLVRQTQPPKPRPAPVRETGLPSPPWVQQSFLERMRRELDLTPAQSERLRAIFADSRERMRLLYSLIGPEVQAEYREVREKIKAELTPQQRRQFEELLRSRPRPRPDGPPGERRPPPLPPPEVSPTNL